MDRLTEEEMLAMWLKFVIKETIAYLLLQVLRGIRLQNSLL